MVRSSVDGVVFRASGREEAGSDGEVDIGGYKKVRSFKKGKYLQIFKGETAWNLETGTRTRPGSIHQGVSTQ